MSEPSRRLWWPIFTFAGGLAVAAGLEIFGGTHWLVVTAFLAAFLVCIISAIWGALEWCVERRYFRSRLDDVDRLNKRSAHDQEREQHACSNHNDTEVSAALIYIGHHSAWARWQDAQHRANAGEPLSDNIKIARATSVLKRKAEEGVLVVHGRRYGALKYERIPAHLWKMTYLDLARDETTLWRATMKPRHGLEQEAVEMVPNYLSLQVSEKRIKKLWPRVDPQLDRETALLLEKADKREGK